MKQGDEIVKGIVCFYIGSIVSSANRLVLFIRKISGNLFGCHPGKINHQGLAAFAIIAWFARLFGVKAFMTRLFDFNKWLVHKMEAKLPAIYKKIA